MGKRVIILGSTGSIGTRAIDVIRSLGSDWKIVGLAAGSNWSKLAEQAREFKPKKVVIANEKYHTQLSEAIASLPTEILSGEENVHNLASMPDADFVICAITGAKSITSVINAINAGHDIGFASKEALVLAGKQIMTLVKQKNINMMPIDSEHSAIFQAMQAGSKNEVEKIILTASGGPFRDWDKEKMQNATLKQALAHPTWAMGTKITVDSATMANKALELIEAHYLFDIDASQIDIVIHPESIVHSFVEFCDGSVIAQLSVPDMAMPIQYALTWPERKKCICNRLDLSAVGRLNFHSPDFDKFPVLKLGYEVAKTGGTAGAVFNASNEQAVELFIKGQIKFGEIIDLVKNVLDKHKFNPEPELEELFEIDKWAREEVLKIAKS